MHLIHVTLTKLDRADRAMRQSHRFMAKLVRVSHHLSGYTIKSSLKFNGNDGSLYSYLNSQRFTYTWYSGGGES